MTQQFDATYKGGVLLPAQGVELSLQDGDLVQVTINSNRSPSPDDVLGLAAGVYDGLTRDEINEVEKIALDRSHFCDSEPGS